MSWVAENREPDGTWHRLFTNADVKVVIRFIRQWRKDRGHLATETRVRMAP